LRVGRLEMFRGRDAGAVQRAVRIGKFLALVLRQELADPHRPPHRTSIAPPKHLETANAQCRSLSVRPGLVARVLVLRVAYVTRAVVEDNRASEHGRVPALRSPDRYLPDRHELLAASRASVVNHVLSLSQPSGPAPSCKLPALSPEDGYRLTDDRGSVKLLVKPHHSAPEPAGRNPIASSGSHLSDHQASE